MPATPLIEVDEFDRNRSARNQPGYGECSLASAGSEPSAALLADLHRVGLALQQLSKQGEDYIWRPCDAALPVIERASAHVHASAKRIASLEWQVRWLVKIANDERLTVAERVGIVANYPNDGVEPPEAMAVPWRPIESAPLNKTVLVWSAELEGTYGVVTAVRTDTGWHSDEVSFESWEEPDYENDDEETMVTINPSPTHWMPLPSPPLAAQDTAEQTVLPGDDQ